MGGAIVMLGMVIGLIFYYSDYLLKILSPSVMKVITRVMGLIIMSIASDLLVTGIKAALFSS